MCALVNSRHRLSEITGLAEASWIPPVRAGAGPRRFGELDRPRRVSSTFSALCFVVPLPRPSAADDCPSGIGGLH